MTDSDAMGLIGIFTIDTARAMSESGKQDIKQQVADLIREARKAKGLTQQELGDRLNLSKTTVNEYEGGKQNLTIETLAKISAALDGAILIVLKK